MGKLSINKKKLIRSLSLKKSRNELGMFIVEGDKTVREVLHPHPGSIPFRLESLVATEEWLEEHGKEIGGGTEILEASPAELRQISLHKEPNRVLALVHKANYVPDYGHLKKSLCVGLENLQDPGNLGSIIRTADWFGIRDILCSVDCVELYNPKVVQSSMGSFLRVRVHTLDLPELIGSLRNTGNETGFQVFATGSGGEDAYAVNLPEPGMILLGNESRGLSDRLLGLSDRVLRIPFQDASLHPDSLNVAAAAAVLCAEFRRQSAAERAGRKDYSK